MTMKIFGVCSIILFLLCQSPVVCGTMKSRDSAKAWRSMYLKGKEKFREGTASSLGEAYRLFSASAQGFPDSYVARDCHLFLARITETADTDFSADEVKRANEHYVPMDSAHWP
jgi:hypothetical protein